MACKHDHKRYVTVARAVWHTVGLSELHWCADCGALRLSSEFGTAPSAWMVPGERFEWIEQLPLGLKPVAK